MYNGIKRRSVIFSDIDSLKRLINKICKVEAPLHIDILKKRLLSIIDVSKFNAQQNELIDNALKNNEEIYLENNFIYLQGSSLIKVRNRKDLDKSMRKIDYISDKEILEAILLSLNSGDATTKNDVIKFASDYLGFNKNANLSAKIEIMIENLLNNNRLYIEDDALFIND